MINIEALEEKYKQEQKAKQEQNKLLALIKKENTLYHSMLKSTEKQKDKLNKLVSKFESLSPKENQSQNTEE